MLTWKRTLDSSRDLQLVNAEDFDKTVFGRLLAHFYKAPMSVKPNERLRHELVALGEHPERAVFTCSGDFRSGYVGLNRWCVTNSPRDQAGVIPARALWKFLFQKGGFSPPVLAASPGKGPLELDVRAWENWYAMISRTDS